MEYFVNSGILKTNNAADGLGFKPNPAQRVVEFAGDDFDKIYTKYFARERGVQLSFAEMQLNDFWQIKLHALLTSGKRLELAQQFRGDITIDILGRTARRMSASRSKEDPFLEEPDLTTEIYFMMVAYNKKAVVPLLRVVLDLPWLKVQSWFWAEAPKHSDPLRKLALKARALKGRASDVGGDLKIGIKSLTVIPVKTLARKVAGSKNERLKRTIALNHELKMYTKYVVEHDIAEATQHADLLYRYNDAPEGPSLSNNLGYLFMAIGQLDKARSLFLRAIETCESSATLALSNYNLGILEAKRNNIPEAVSKVKASIELSENLDKQGRQVSCLFIPHVNGPKLEFEEILNPDILEVAKRTKETLESLLPTVQTVLPGETSP